MDGAGGRSPVGNEPVARAGEGGAGSTSQCETDLDCDDGRACTGEERCSASVCEGGTPIECDGGTVCDETDPDEPCVYARSSPWLVLLSYEKVLGLPTAELGKRKLLTLGQRVGTGVFVGMNAIAFSPNGRHALIDFWAPDFGQAVLEVSFNRGVPAPAHNLENLPNWGSYSVPTFSHDGARALVSEVDSGAYLLGLAGRRGESSQLDVPTFRGDEVAFCSDDHTWLRSGPKTTLYTLTDGHALANDLGHDDQYDVELSPDARKIWLGGESPRLVSCAGEATSAPLGVVAESAEFSPDSRWLLLSLADGSTQLLSVAESLTAAEVWSGSSVAEWFWSDGAGALLVRLETEVASSYGYFDLSQSPPVLRTLALDGAASILGCGSSGCLARSPEQADSAEALLFQPFNVEAAPAPIGDASGAPATVALADFQRGRLVLRRTSEMGHELTLTDFAGAPERQLFDWDKGSVHVDLASDDTGVAIRVEDDNQHSYSNFWVTFPTTAEPDAKVVSLDVAGGHQTVFQPWP